MTKINITPLTYTQPNPDSIRGNNIVLVRKIINEIAVWSEQFEEDDAVTLKKAMADLEELMITCWTEVDESLTRLCFAENHLKHKKIDNVLEYIDTAKFMLNRWQGRGGKIGNFGGVIGLNISSASPSELAYKE